MKLEDAMAWKLMWKKQRNENFKANIPSYNYDTPKTTGECGMF